MKLEVSEGVVGLLAQAGTSNVDRKVESLTLSGDLLQMSTMGRTLRDAGLDVRNSDVYPVLQGEDIRRGLQILWDRKVDGWWNQREALIERGICSEEEFRRALG